MELIRGLIKGYLMKETIGACSSYKASYSRLVRDILKIKIQVVLKHEDVSMVAVPEAGRHGVELSYPFTPNTVILYAPVQKH